MIPPAPVNTGIFALFILCIGTSQIYLGVHYPSDVLAHVAVGGTWLTLTMLTMHENVDQDTGYLEGNQKWWPLLLQVKRHHRNHHVLVEDKISPQEPAGLVV
ncbi:phosphatase PAP2 family protein [Desulfofundulus thermocisternus]|uniref:phosphatase PAP2 family protein n=1 Tax=Desulfofundulus thermocisternus TaxID=42471 RepID=UPI00217D348E|nr:phosphatase PAP2 family protein [Desulfofundulus thermocisternus]MCS5695927.1 phosphatase PAP2 family protein [Desulfofundulus thermocisternus]